MNTTNLNGKLFSTSVFTPADHSLKQTSSLGVVDTTLLDNSERPTSIQHASFVPVLNTYDSSGRVSTLSQGANRKTTFAYDPVTGFLASLKNSLSQVTKFTSDLMGRVLTVTLPDNRLVKFSYDKDGNVTSVTPAGRAAHTFASNGFGLLTKYLAPASSSTSLRSTTQYTYDHDRNLIQVARPDHSLIKYNYDSVKGTLTSVMKPEGTDSFTYSGSLLTRLLSSDQILRNIQYFQRSVSEDTVYDNSSNSIYTRVDYQYQAGHVTSETVSSNFNNSSVINYLFDSDENLVTAGAESIVVSPVTGLNSSTTLGANEKVNYGYSADFGELSQSQSLYNGTLTYQEDLIRDNLGRISARTEKYGNISNTYAYTFDATGRLTDVKLNGVVVNHFLYDANSNRTSQVISGVTTSATYDGQDKLLTFGSSSFGYNLNGEMISKNSTSPTSAQSYTFDSYGNLKAVNLPTNLKISYKLDAKGRRFSRSSGSVVTQIYIYDQADRIIATLDSSGAVTARYVYGVKNNIPDYVVKGTKRYQIVSDHLGSPVQVIDTATGAVIQEMHYTVFGAVTSDTNPGFTPFGFAGGVYDQDIKLTHFGAREYDASIGRWLSKDPILFSGGDTNLYGYVLNDPINSIDPNGFATLQAGGAFNIQVGPFGFQGGGGLALDSKGNIGVYTYKGGAVGAGMTTGLGGSLQFSNAANIDGLKDRFNTASVHFGSGYGGGLDFFNGTDEKNNIVYGGGFTFGAQAGASACTGQSYTDVLHLNGAK